MDVRTAMFEHVLPPMSSKLLKMEALLLRPLTRLSAKLIVRRTEGHVHMPAWMEGLQVPLAALALVSEVCGVIGQSFCVGVV